MLNLLLFEVEMTASSTPSYYLFERFWLLVDFVLVGKVFWLGWRGTDKLCHQRPTAVEGVTANGKYLNIFSIVFIIMLFTLNYSCCIVYYFTFNKRHED